MASSELASLIATQMERAERPNPYFPRDGALLRRPIGDSGIRLEGAALAARLEDVLSSQAEAWRAVIASAWAGGRELGKDVLACLRALAYLALGSDRGADLEMSRPRDVHGNTLGSNAALVQAQRDAAAAAEAEACEARSVSACAIVTCTCQKQRCWSAGLR